VIVSTVESHVKFFAHSTKTADKSDWQLLSDHLSCVGELAARNATPFGAAHLARPVGLLHDLGKYTNEFQKRLTGEFPKVDHATWGARIAREKYSLLGLLMAYGIAGHHAGLANGKRGQARTALQDRLQNELPGKSNCPRISIFAASAVPSNLRY